MYRGARCYDMDRSLDEFLNQSDTNPDQDTRTSHESRNAESKTETETKTKAETESESKTKTEMAVGATMVWTADGTACESCSDVVRRRWRDDDQLVCTACKEW